MTEFEPFPKIPRLRRGCVITEKIDGTNASLFVTDHGELYAASRNRFITPDDDNFGFAAWAFEHMDELVAGLGAGRHFGEWWGSGIQRGYDQPGKRFSLFNTARWVAPAGQHWGYGKKDYAEIPEVTLPKIDGLGVVPTLYEGPFSTITVEQAITGLRAWGSAASPGFGRPEGVVVYHTASRSYFKQTIEGDEAPKGRAAA